MHDYSLRQDDAPYASGAYCDGPEITGLSPSLVRSFVVEPGLVGGVI